MPISRFIETGKDEETGAPLYTQEEYGSRVFVYKPITAIENVCEKQALSICQRILELQREVKLLHVCIMAADYQSVRYVRELHTRAKQRMLAHAADYVKTALYANSEVEGANDLSCIPIFAERDPLFTLSNCREIYETALDHDLFFCEEAYGPEARGTDDFVADNKVGILIVVAQTCLRSGKSLSNALKLCNQRDISEPFYKAHKRLSHFAIEHQVLIEGYGDEGDQANEERAELVATCLAPEFVWRDDLRAKWLMGFGLDDADKSSHDSSDIFKRDLFCRRRNQSRKSDSKLCGEDEHTPKVLDATDCENIRKSASKLAERFLEKAKAAECLKTLITHKEFEPCQDVLLDLVGNKSGAYVYVRPYLEEFWRKKAEENIEVT